jgi:hypothetical protein
MYAHRAGDFFINSLMANQVRGTDSTGIFQVDRENHISWRKQAINATDFVTDTTTKLQLNRATSMMVNVGHVRAATSGSVTTENAHPFEAERSDGTRIIGVHNGSLVSGWKDKPFGKDFAVDSDWMMHMLAQEGADAFEHFNGAFALVWYDTKHPDHIFMARNKDRPLCYMVTEDRRSMLGASELGMLTWLAGRNQFKLAKDGPFKTPFYLADGKIYKFSLKELGNFEKFDFPKYKYTGTVYEPAGGDWRNQGGTGNTQLTHWRDHRESTYHIDRVGGRYPNDDTFDEGIDPWDERFNSALRSRVTRVETDWDYEMQESVLQSVKDELSAARYSLVPSSSANPGDTTVIDGEIVDVEDYHVVDVDSVVDGDQLDRAMHRALVKQSKSVEPAPVQRSRPMDKITLDDITLLSTNTSSATTGEIKVAKDLGIFGRVVEFKGIDFDDANSSCLGVFTMKDPAAGEDVDCDGEIRYLTKKVAEDLYIKRKSHLAIIIGFHKEAAWAICAIPSVKEKEFIYSSITPSGQSQAASN